MNKSGVNSSYNNVSAYNPWENKAVFIQDTGRLDDFLLFINKLEQKEDYTENSEELSDDEELKLLRQLNESSKCYFDRINEIELLYEKYKYEYILSKKKQDELLDKLNDLILMFKLIEANRVKIANILLNSHFSENNTVKIKHSHKSKFIKILKIIITYLKEGNELDFIQRSFNLHFQTIDKLKFKIEEIYSTSSKLLLKYKDLDKYNIDSK
jgi:hypothetical protein